MRAQRVSEHVDDVVTAGSLVVSAEAASRGWLDGRALRLTARQVRLLALLIQARGALLTRDELYRGATGRVLPMKSRAVDTDLWRIRKELGCYGSAIRAVRKVGYALDAAVLERTDVTDP